MREAFNVRIEESRIIDACFLHGCDRPTICVLYEPSRGTRAVKTYTVDSRGKLLTPGPWSKASVESTGHMLIPVPSPSRGVCLVGRTSVSYMDRSGGVQTISFGADMYATTFGRIDDIGSRYLLGDQRGNLFVLVLLSDPSQEGTVRGLALEHLGETSVASSICYLDNGIVFIGSALADSQLVRLRPQAEVEAGGPDALTPVVEVLATYNNIGPIMDMCVVQKEGHGQPQV
jgi:DNA damage-binding protein 1